MPKYYRNNWTMVTRYYSKIF